MFPRFYAVKSASRALRRADRRAGSIKLRRPEAKLKALKPDRSQPELPVQAYAATIGSNKGGKPPLKNIANFRAPQIFRITLYAGIAAQHMPRLVPLFRWPERLDFLRLNARGRRFRLPRIIGLPPH
jgi:hypothetical protein